MKPFILFFALFCAESFAEQPQRSCEFPLICAINAKGFAIRVSSPSKDCGQEDGQVSLKTTSGTDAQIKVDAALYLETENEGNASSICKITPIRNYPVFAVSESVVILILRSFAAVFPDRITAVAVDVQSGQTLDTKVLGEINQNVPTTFSQTPSGIVAQLNHKAVEFWFAEGKIQTR